jgi:hypothetical protein
MNVMVEAIISGSVGAHYYYPAYDYSDRIGVSTNFAITLNPIPAVAPEGGIIGMSGYKLVFKETMNNPFNSPAIIDYYWSFSVEKWNGAQWVASGISGSSTLATGYAIPALSIVDLPYYVYLLPASGPNALAWGDWLRINYTFHWTHSSTNYSIDYAEKLHVHPGDITGAGSVAFPYLEADGICDISDAAVIGGYWQNTVPPDTDPTSLLARADLTGDGIIDISDAAIIGGYWQMTWTSTPP